MGDGITISVVSGQSEPGERWGVGRWNQRKEESIQAGRADSSDDFLRFSAVRYKAVSVQSDILSSEFRAMLFDPTQRRRRIARVERLDKDARRLLIIDICWPMVKECF